MSRRIWTGVAAGVLAASVLLAVAGGANRAGQRDEAVTRTAGDGEVVRVVGGHGWGYGPGPGFLLFPLAVVAVILLARGRRGGADGWSGGWRPPTGPPEEAFREWHRRAHAEPEPAPAPAAGSPGG